MTGRRPSHQELVLAKEPLAFEHDDGERVYVYVQRAISDPCPHCKQMWTRTEKSLAVSPIGAGGSSEFAWKDAAQTLSIDCGD